MDTDAMLLEADEPAVAEAPTLRSREVATGAPIFIVMNAGSGRGDGEAIRRQVGDVLAQAGREHHFRVVDDPASLRSTAADVVAQAKARGGIVVAAGGDGTINTVAQATLGSGCAFGVLPLGTFNYFSRTHGIPSDPGEAATMLLADRAYEVQVGRINDRVFLVNASLGLYPQLLEDREQAKRQFGRSRLVALWSALGTLMREHRQLRLRIDAADGSEAVVRTPTLFVGNNRLQLERIGIDESRVIEHRRLAAVVVRPVSSWTMLWLTLRGALGRLGEDEHVRSFSFGRMWVRPHRPYGSKRIKVATDGEILWMRAPIEFAVCDEPLLLLRPAVVEGDPG